VFTVQEEGKHGALNRGACMHVQIHRTDIHLARTAPFCWLWRHLYAPFFCMLVCSDVTKGRSWIWLHLVHRTLQ
jgi:hypothetical protein